MDSLRRKQRSGEKIPRTKIQIQDSNKFERKKRVSASPYGRDPESMYKQIPPNKLVVFERIPVAYTLVTLQQKTSNLGEALLLFKALFEPFDFACPG